MDKLEAFKKIRKTAFIVKLAMAAIAAIILIIFLAGK